MNRKMTVLADPELYGDGVRMLVRAMAHGNPLTGTWSVYTTMQVDTTDPRVCTEPDEATDTGPDGQQWTPVLSIARTGLWVAEKAHAAYAEWVSRYENAGWCVVERREWTETSRHDQDSAMEAEAESEIRRTPAPSVWQDSDLVPLVPGLILRDEDDEWRWVSAAVTRGRAPYITEMCQDWTRVALAPINHAADEITGGFYNPSQVASERGTLFVVGEADTDLTDDAAAKLDGEPRWTAMHDPRQRTETGHGAE